MFNELIITKDGFSMEEGGGHGEWNNMGNIILNSRAMTKSWSRRKDGFEGRERSIEEIVHFINKLFLTEFICMEMAGGIQKNVKCDKILWCRCTPRMTAKEMLRNGKIRTCEYCNKELTLLEYKSGLCKCEDY